MLPLVAREGLPRPKQRMSVCTRVSYVDTRVDSRVRWLSLAIGQVGRACEHSSSEGRSMSAGSRVLDDQVC
jgi:hypothetical protein